MSTDAHPSTAATDSTDSTGSADSADPAAAVRRERILEDVAALRASFDAGTTRSIPARLAQLAALQKGLRAERGRLTKALAQDLGKSRLESAITELGVVSEEISYVSKHLKSWLRPEKFSMGLLLAPATGELQREPLGTTLIIAPWNYPVNLTLAPVVAAIA
ncbi:MAG: aldehyde dehydrogenase family protein, partial [Brachybacterium tyrofermentans]